MYLDCAFLMLHNTSVTLLTQTVLDTANTDTNTRKYTNKGEYFDTIVTSRDYLKNNVQLCLST